MLNVFVKKLLMLKIIFSAGNYLLFISIAYIKYMKREVNFKKRQNENLTKNAKYFTLQQKQSNKNKFSRFDISNKPVIDISERLN